jgi:hypothetical protein
MAEGNSNESRRGRGLSCNAIPMTPYDMMAPGVTPHVMPCARNWARFMYLSAPVITCVWMSRNARALGVSERSKSEEKCGDTK